MNTNLVPILHRFRDIAFDRSIAIFGYPSWMGFPGTISIIFYLDVKRWPSYQMA